MPLAIGVVVNAYRERGYLEGALSSICRQSLAPRSVIVLGSVSEETKARYPGFTFLPCRDGEPAGETLGNGVRAAYDCDLISFLEDDDFWDPDHLWFASRWFYGKNGSNVSLVRSRMIKFRTGGELVQERFKRKAHECGILKEREYIPLGLFRNPSTMIFRREALLPWLDVLKTVHWCPDHLLFSAALASGGDLVHENHGPTFYRVHENQSTSYAMTPEQYLERGVRNFTTIIGDVTRMLEAMNGSLTPARYRIADFMRRRHELFRAHLTADRRAIIVETSKYLGALLANPTALDEWDLDKLVLSGVGSVYPQLARKFSVPKEIR